MDNIRATVCMLRTASFGGEMRVPESGRVAVYSCNRAIA